MSNNATDQATPLLDENGKFAKGNKPPTGFHTNPERRNPGGWVKSDTPRFKLEQMMKLGEDELRKVAESKDAPLFERKLAIAIRKGVWKEIESMINQVYGAPKQTIEQTNIEAPKPLFDRSKDAKHDNPGKDTKVKKAN